MTPKQKATGLLVWVVIWAAVLAASAIQYS